MFRSNIFSKLSTKNLRQILPEETCKKIEEEQEKNDEEFLINQLDFLNGNYPDLIRNKLYNSTDVNTQLDFYLNRFLTSNTPWFVLGGDDWQKHGIPFITGCTPLRIENTKFHSSLIIDMFNTGSRVRHGGICIMYFVNTPDELIDIHNKSLNKFKKVTQYDREHYPFPPAILILQNEASPLHDHKTLLNCNVPVLDTWYVPNTNSNSTGKRVSYSTWEEYLHRLTPLFFRLAVTMGMVNQEILQNQVAFLEFANQTTMPPKEVWNIIGEYLFQINLNNSLMKKDYKKTPNDHNHVDEKRCSIM